MSRSPLIPPVGLVPEAFEWFKIPVVMKCRLEWRGKSRSPSQSKTSDSLISSVNLIPKDSVHITIVIHLQSHTDELWPWIPGGQEMSGLCDPEGAGLSGTRDKRLREQQVKTDPRRMSVVLSLKSYCALFWCYLNTCYCLIQVTLMGEKTNWIFVKVNNFIYASGVKISHFSSKFDIFINW